MTQPEDDIVANLVKRVDDHESRIKKLEPLRELVLALHEEVLQVRETKTVILKRLDHTDETVSSAIREASRKASEYAREVLHAEVEHLTERINCLNCVADPATKKPKA